MSGIVTQRTLDAVRVAITLLVPIIAAVGLAAFVTSGPTPTQYLGGIFVLVLGLVAAASVVPLIGGRE